MVALSVLIPHHTARAASLRGAPSNSDLAGMELGIDRAAELSESDLPSLHEMEERDSSATLDWPGENMDGAEVADGDENELEDYAEQPVEAEQSVDETLDPAEELDNVEHLKHVGMLADTNNDTMLSVEELRHFAEKLKDRKRWEHTKAALSALDADRDGQVARQELGAQVMENASSIDARRFEAADRNGDGVLNTTEFHTFAHPETHAEVLKVEAEHQFKHFDADANGRITFAEFKLEDESDEDFSEEASREDFDIHDTDGSGDLDAMEFEKLMGGHALLSDSINKAIAAADGDGDGHIHIHEEVPQSVQGLLGSEFIEDFFYHEYVESKHRHEL